jgi:FKBP-type peptidyl-prolyl cis-trans isomerase FklB
LTRNEAARLIGVNFGQQLQRLGITDPEALESLSRGIKQGLAGTKATAEEPQRLAHFFYASTKAAISSNINNAHAFLLRNGAEKDVHTTSSGLQYTVIAAGNPAARSPTLADQVTVRYRGTLLDGTEFDGSDVPGAPTTFLVGGVIKGWQEALLMMKPGARWRLFVPPELAYGNKARRNIPGGSLLIFDVELTGVTAAAAANASRRSFRRRRARRMDERARARAGGGGGARSGLDPRWSNRRRSLKKASMRVRLQARYSPVISGRCGLRQRMERS